MNYTHLTYEQRYHIDVSQRRDLSCAVNIGLKSGRGFYDYSKRDLPAYRKDVLARTLGALKHAGLFRPSR